MKAFFVERKNLSNRALFPCLHSLIYTRRGLGEPETQSRVCITQPRSQGPISTSRKYPGYGWSRVCQILADSRDMIEGRGWKVKVCLHRAHLLSPVGSGVCNSRQNLQRRLTHPMLESNAFNARLKAQLCIWLNFSQLTVGWSLEFMAVKKFGKELGNDDHDNKWTAR